MLIGEYIHSIDTKKRLALPAKWRALLGKTVIMTRGLEGCLTIYTMQEWEKVSGMFSNSPFATEAERGFARYFLSAATEIDVDAAGRILIPESLRRYAGLDQKVVFTGIHNRIELWDEGKWNAYMVDIERDAAKIAAEICAK